MSQIMQRGNAKSIRTSIAVCDLLSLLHFSLSYDSFLLMLFFLIHFSNLSDLLLKHRNLLSTRIAPLFLQLLIDILELEQLLMQTVDLFAELIILSFELTYHGL